MGGYNSSDDEREGSGPGAGRQQQPQQASTPPEYRFLAQGRRSLVEYLLSTSSGGGQGATMVDSPAAPASAPAAPVEEAAVEPATAAAVAVGAGSSSSSSSVADSASFERIGACTRACSDGALLSLTHPQPPPHPHRARARLGRRRCRPLPVLLVAAQLPPQQLRQPGLLPLPAGHRLLGLSGHLGQRRQQQRGQQPLLWGQRPVAPPPPPRPGGHACGQ